MNAATKCGLVVFLILLLIVAGVSVGNVLKGNKWNGGDE